MTGEATGVRRDLKETLVAGANKTFCRSAILISSIPTASLLATSARCLRLDLYYSDLSSFLPLPYISLFPLCLLYIRV